MKLGNTLPDDLRVAINKLFTVIGDMPRHAVPLELSSARMGITKELMRDVPDPAPLVPDLHARVTMMISDLRALMGERHDRVTSDNKLRFSQGHTHLTRENEYDMAVYKAALEAASALHTLELLMRWEKE